MPLPPASARLTLTLAARGVRNDVADDVAGDDNFLLVIGH
jgi:hypothetical protein